MAAPVQPMLRGVSHGYQRYILETPEKARKRRRESPQFRLPETALEFTDIYGLGPLDQFIDDYYDVFSPRYIDSNGEYNLSDILPDEVLLELQRTFHLPTKQQEEFIVAPFLPQQTATCFMRVIVRECYLRMGPNNYASPWVRIDVEKAGPQGIFSDVFHPRWITDMYWGTEDRMTLVYPRQKVYKLMTQAASLIWNKFNPQIQDDVRLWLDYLEKNFPKDAVHRPPPLAYYTRFDAHPGNLRSAVDPVIPHVNMKIKVPEKPRADLWRTPPTDEAVSRFINQFPRPRRRSFDNAHRPRMCSCQQRQLEVDYIAHEHRYDAEGIRDVMWSNRFKNVVMFQPDMDLKLMMAQSIIYPNVGQVRTR